VRAKTGILAAALAALAALAPVSAAAAAPSRLRHAGRWITDRQGRAMVVHGFNMVYKKPPYAPDAAGFGEDDAAFLAGEGYDAVRVGLIYKAVEPAPGVYDDAYLDRIAATVRTLASHGIQSVLDFHQDLYNERFAGEGWPDWAVQDDGLPNQPNLGFPANYLAMPALQRAFDHFWANDAGPGGVGLQDRYAAAWAHVAQRFRASPSVLGYELLNEPWPGTLWAQCANPVGCPVFDAMLAAFTKRTMTAIRRVDPRTLIWYEPNVIFNDGADTQIGDTGDPRAGFAFHDYCLLTANSTDPLQGAACDRFDDLVFANAAKQTARTGDAIMLTEFGATTDAGILRRMADRADRDMVPWLEWHYCACDDPTTSGPGDTQAVVSDPRRPPEGDNVDTAKLAVLSRPYPRAVAGTPLAFGFDPDSREFALRYSTRRPSGKGAFPAGARTEVVVPRRQYRDGYGVEVEGARVVSPPGAGVLRLAACPGAGEIGVRVRSGAALPPGDRTCRRKT
jgi:endoglycosylceramidase